jgi:hypothetical protein
MERSDSHAYHRYIRVPPNRGATTRYTGSLCTSQNPTSKGIAELCLIDGTMQYANVFVQLTCLAKPQAQAVGFEAPFSDLTTDFATRRDFAKGIHRSNEVENVSILAYIHEFGHVHSSVIGKRPTLVVVKTVLIEPGMLQYQHGRLFFSKILDAT